MYKKIMAKLSTRLAMAGLILGLLVLAATPSSAQTTIARGGGNTIIEGGTGSPSFTPVLTTFAFHAESSGNTITGSFQCLARAPESPGSTGASQSAHFDVNVMYVVGQINGATASGDKVTLTGTATVTGLGAGTNVPFTATVQQGGPGSTVVLKVSGLTFHEILLDGGHIQLN